jgi:hypothetical protein
VSAHEITNARSPKKFESNAAFHEQAKASAGADADCSAGGHQIIQQACAGLRAKFSIDFPRDER